MKPVRMKMQAFGPYAGTQTVDFISALDAGVFGIYGPTGSGKSSIFNAMSFALFGQPAKDDQDAATLRSDHAKLDCLTEVELTFEIGAKRYLVRRRPEQVRPAIRGGGETREQHCAWLFDVTDIALEDISDDNLGRPLAEKKTTAVAEEVQRILGYGPEQFRQIVLLPQGRFETFLAAKTADRLKILRDLFDVSLYRLLVQKLVDDAKEAQAKILADRRAYQSRLSQEGFETRDDLTVGVAAAQAEHTAAAGATKTAQKNAKAVEKLLGDAMQVEKSFLENNEAQSALKTLTEKAGEIEEQKRVYRGALVARSLQDVDRATEVARQHVGDAEKAYADAKGAHAGAKEVASEKSKLLEAEQARGQELERLRERLAEYGRHQGTLDDAQGQKSERDEAANHAKGAAKAFDDANTELERLRQLRSDQSAQLKTAEDTESGRTSLAALLQEVEKKLQTAQVYAKAVKSVADGEAECAKIREQHEGEAGALDAALKGFESADAALTTVQAIHLAAKLEPGEACPVCGALDHPDIAKGDAQSAGLDSAFREARAVLDGARKREAQSGRDLAAAKSALAERKTNLEALERPEQETAAIQQQQLKLKAELEKLGPAVDLDALRDRLTALEAQIEEVAGRLEVARTEKQSSDTKLALTAQALETALASVPEDLWEPSALAEAADQLKKDIERRVTALKEAVDVDQKARETVVAAAKDEENAAKNHARALETLNSAEKALADRLAAEGLTAEQYRDHKANIDRIDALQQLIEEYGRQMAAAQDRAHRAKDAIAELERPDIEALTARNEELEGLYSQAVNREAGARARAEQLKKLEESIAATVAGLEEAERDFAPLGELAEVLRGSNSARIHLETFAIAAMFDRVLDAANLRLRPMTGGRYSLERRQEGGKGAAQRGLDIVVHDVHTGRARDISTLSGGESFMAALALALGLSDIVQSTAGGIRLDTIFIDEGFGSLDPETLDQALQTLQEVVGDNRAVGLISHVELVQQAIPNGFEISKSPTGSHVSERGVI